MYFLSNKCSLDECKTLLSKTLQNNLTDPKLLNSSFKHYSSREWRYTDIKLACYQSSLTWTQPEAKSTSSTSSSAALQETGSISLPKVEKRHRNQQNTDQSLLSKREKLKINTLENFWYGFDLLVSLPVFWERWFCKSPQAFFGLKLPVQWLGLVLRVLL